MIHLIALWLLVLGFTGAGLANLIGAPAMQRSFVRWGYPPWWCRITGGLELVVAMLIAFTLTRTPGLLLDAAVILAAIATVLRHRDFGHLLPPGVFAVSLGVALSTLQARSRGSVADIHEVRSPFRHEGSVWTPLRMQGGSEEGRRVVEVLPCVRPTDAAVLTPLASMEVAGPVHIVSARSESFSEVMLAGRDGG